MMLSTVTALVEVLPALATLAAGTTRTARLGKRVRMYRPETTMVEGPTVEAVTALLTAGYTVKVYEGTKVFTPAFVEGALVWAFRTTTKNRAAVVVEVTFAKN